MAIMPRSPPCPEAEQDDLIDRAEAETWSEKRLREEVAQHRRSVPARSPGDATDEWSTQLAYLTGSTNKGATMTETRPGGCTCTLLADLVRADLAGVELAPANCLLHHPVPAVEAAVQAERQRNYIAWAGAELARERRGGEPEPEPTDWLAEMRRDLGAPGSPAQHLCQLLAGHAGDEPTTSSASATPVMGIGAVDERVAAQRLGGAVSVAPSDEPDRHFDPFTTPPSAARQQEEHDR
jgi:hypothetical protein